MQRCLTGHSRECCFEPPCGHQHPRAVCMHNVGAPDDLMACARSLVPHKANSLPSQAAHAGDARRRCCAMLLLRAQAAAGEALVRLLQEQQQHYQYKLQAGERLLCTGDDPSGCVVQLL